MINGCNYQKPLQIQVFDYFFDETSKMFYFTSNKDTQLIARKMEIEDNVMPASEFYDGKKLI